MRPAFLFMALLAWPLSAQAVDLALLTDVICEYETRGERFPDEYVGIHGEVGRCAVRISTAEFLGYKGTGLGLMDRETNMKYAKAWLAYCRGRGRKSVYSMAKCYNEGLTDPEGKSSYAKQVATTYAHRFLYPIIKLAMR